MFQAHQGLLPTVGSKTLHHVSQPSTVQQPSRGRLENNCQVLQLSWQSVLLQFQGPGATLLTDVGSNPKRDHLISYYAAALELGKNSKRKNSNRRYVICEANAELSARYGKYLKKLLTLPSFGLPPVVELIPDVKISLVNKACGHSQLIIIGLLLLRL